MKYFTVDEANNILPQIKLLVEEIIEKRTKLYDEMDKFENMEEDESQDILESMYIKSSIKQLNKEINELIEIIESFGAVVKGLDPFLIDFPSEHLGNPILLCWKEGEEKIEFWHDLSSGFMGRKPISELKQEQNKFF